MNFFASVQTYKISEGSNTYFLHCMYSANVSQSITLDLITVCVKNGKHKLVG